MKKIIGLAALCLSAGFITNTTQAQSKAKKVESDVKKDATVAGNKTAEVASKGAARIKDKIYKDKVGPSGQTIYINGHDKYYWIDDKGHKQYIDKSELVDKQS